MEEKEPIKVKLSTVLLIITIIIIAAIGVIIGIMYQQSMTKNNNVPEVENVMLGEKENVINNNSNKEKTFSETEIKEALQNYLKLSGAYQGDPYSVLYVMKEITGKNVIDDEYPKSIEYGEGSILPTKIKYSEFKEFMLNYMTEELYNTDFARGYIDKNGDLYCKNIGATGVTYEVKSIEKINKSDTKYKGNVYGYSEEEYKDEMEILFEVSENNEKCVISSITFTNKNEKDVDEKDDNDSSDNTATKVITNESKKETSKTDYAKYIGTWSDGSENEFKVRNIGNDLITFTWFIYRTALIEDVTVPFKDNKAVFYYHGYEDKNFNNKDEDNEFYCRKAIIELKKNNVSIKVENSTLEESNKNISLDKTDLFGGGVHIKPGQYTFTTKK